MQGEHREYVLIFPSPLVDSSANLFAFVWTVLWLIDFPLVASTLQFR